jgi:hypothetical protein
MAAPRRVLRSSAKVSLEPRTASFARQVAPSFTAAVRNLLFDLRGCLELIAKPSGSYCQSVCNLLFPRARMRRRRRREGLPGVECHEEN